jgi:MerR family copper efflux transcriptional regulator
MDGTYNIGRTARETGISVKMIRHYEAVGLLPKAIRTRSNYRVYGANDVHTLRFIKRARTLGFSMADIKELVGLWHNRSRSSASVKRIAGRHVTDLKGKIAAMQSMVDVLGNLAEHCHGDHRPECPILEDLSRKDA